MTTLLRQGFPGTRYRKSTQRADCNTGYLSGIKEGQTTDGLCQRSVRSKKKIKNKTHFVNSGLDSRHSFVQQCGGRGTGRVTDMQSIFISNWFPTKCIPDQL